MKVSDEQLKSVLDDYFSDRPLVGKDQVIALVDERFNKAVQAYIAPHKVEEVEPVGSVFHDTFQAKVRKAKLNISHDRSTFEEGSEDDYVDIEATEDENRIERLNKKLGN